MKHISDIVTKAGGIEAVAAACHIKPDAVLAWSRHNHIPARNVAAVAALAGVTGAAVMRWASKCTPAPRRAYGRKKQ